MTGWPSRLSCAITPFQLEESAKAPWTSTTVGVVVSVRGSGVVLVVDPFLSGRGCR
jgi:hypothetical protein